MSLWLAHCYFCVTAPAGEYVLTSDAEVSMHDRQGGTTRQRMVLPICGEHHRILQRAGKQGKVHGRTGVRWWLGVR